MTVEIPADVQPFIRNAVASGIYVNEQEAVTAILRVAASSLEGYEEIKQAVKRSVQDELDGRVEEADFSKLRSKILGASK